MSRRPWMIIGAVVSAVGLAVGAIGCVEETDESFPAVELDDLDDGDSGDCELRYRLPAGESFALETHEVTEPESLAPVADDYVGSIPPVLLFADGLTDGTDDPLDLVGGLGERTGYGFDETPGTEQDVYSMYYGSISPENCQYQARLDGQAVDLEMQASTEVMELDLSGFSALTEGLSILVEDVVLEGTFNTEVDRLEDVVLSGVVRDEGLDELLETAGDMLPLSEDQILSLLDPDDEGDIPVELQMSGRQIVVEGFIDADDDDELEPRPDAGDCCPDDLAVGESILSHLRWEQQGIDSRQYELFQMALPEFRGDDHIAMVATARRQDDGTVHYEVYSGGALPEGRIVYRRDAGNGGTAPHFEVVEQSGVNPLGNTDPTALSTYEELLQTGANPNNVSYSDEGYLSGDPRLAFVPPVQMHYPFAMERIAQNFDDPRAGDLMVLPASWSTAGFGTHGNLGALQSRAPLVMAGPGIRSADDDEFGTVEEMGDGASTLLLEDGVRQVDIAPTVAAALGVDTTTGVGPDLRLSDDVYLGWQDGRVLSEVFTDSAIDAVEAGEPVADRAVIIVNDGLTNVELFHQTLSDDPDFEVDSYRRLLESGVGYRYGAISNFPSNTFPGHNTIGSGAWAGHHGVVDNRFLVREQALSAAPIGSLFETEYLFGSAHHNLPVETLYEAVERTHGGLDDNVMTASINEPSTRGADFASLEYREPEGFEVPAEGNEVMIGDSVVELPEADVEDYTGVMDNTTIQTFASLFQDHVERGEEGLPIPMLTYMNMASTDTAGHAHGPHGDETRFDVVSRTNQRMNAMWDVLEHLELDDSTLVVLTADHGMELQDRSRMTARSSALNEADVSFQRHGWYYYFSELAVEVEDIDDSGAEVTVSLRVVDRATAQTEDPAGVEEVTIEVIDDATGSAVETDEDGYADVIFQPDEGATSALLEFNHPDWNMHRQRLEF